MGSPETLTTAPNTAARTHPTPISIVSYSDKVCRQSHNWLVHRIIVDALVDVAPRYSSGRLADIGCADKPWRSIFSPFVDDHIGVDHADSLHDSELVDVVADAYDTTLESQSFDTLLCSAVLEHLERPLDAIQEMYRILKPGGHAILTVPLFWHVHEEPRDFYRYTEYGLRYLSEAVGFEVVEVRPLSGFLVTCGQELCYFLRTFRRRRILRPFISLSVWMIQHLAYRLRRWDDTKKFTWMYLLVIRKPD